MAEQFSLKYRPTTFDEMIVGNPEVLTLAKSMAKKAQAVLIVGESGTGKTTLAHVLNNYLNEDKAEACLIDVNCGMDTSIENVRDLSRKLEYQPVGRKTVVILDEVHMWKNAAASALLKMLENPPHSKILFALCTDQPYRLLKPLVNRCRHLQVEKPEVETLSDYLFNLVVDEKLMKITDKNEKLIKKLMKSIAEASNCVQRQAMQMLEDAVDLHKSGQKISEIKTVVTNAQDKDLDNVVGSLIIAMYTIASGGAKPEKAIAYMHANMPTEVYGLVTRLQSAIYYGTQMKYKGKFNWLGKLYQEALDARKITPDIMITTRILLHLNELRERLKEPASDPVILVGQSLSSLMIALEV